MDVEVSGGAKLKELAARFKEVGAKSLSSEMSTALTKATDPLKAGIKDSADETMPHRGGYQRVFAKSLRFRVARKNAGESATVTLTTYADGTSERRDITSLEAGKLRHPVFGRSRPGRLKGQRHANPWAVTSIRAGFFERGTEHAADEVQDAMLAVIDAYTERLAGPE